jgi:hypothetical protein
MGTKDAVLDAIAQLKAQGVDVSASTQCCRVGFLSRERPSLVETIGRTFAAIVCERLPRSCGDYHPLPLSLSALLALNRSRSLPVCCLCSLLLCVSVSPLSLSPLCRSVGLSVCRLSVCLFVCLSVCLSPSLTHSPSPSPSPSLSIVKERVLRHYLQHDMSAYKNMDLGDADAAVGAGQGGGDAHADEGGDAVEEAALEEAAEDPDLQ